MNHMGAMVSILTGLERTVHLEDPGHTLEPAGLDVSHSVVTKGSVEARSWRSILRLPNGRSSLALWPPLP